MKFTVQAWSTYSRSAVFEVEAVDAEEAREKVYDALANDDIKDAGTDAVVQVGLGELGWSDDNVEIGEPV